MIRNGFTLIELLAVIVILAIIALIAVPLVLNIIEDTKTKSYDISVENIAHGAKLYDLESQFSEENILTDQNIYEQIISKTKGQKPTNGMIYINKNGKIAYSLQYGDWCYTKSYEEDKYTKEKSKTCKAPFNYLKVVPIDNGGDQLIFENPYNIKKNQIE